MPYSHTALRCQRPRLRQVVLLLLACTPALLVLIPSVAADAHLHDPNALGLAAAAAAGGTDERQHGRSSSSSSSSSSSVSIEGRGGVLEGLSAVGDMASRRSVAAGAAVGGLLATGTGSKAPAPKVKPAPKSKPKPVPRPSPKKAGDGATGGMATSAIGTRSEAGTARPSRPNFVVIVTDDQDDILNSTHRAYMPALNRLMADGGTRFSNTLVSTSVCCPARVSLLTGRLPHCTNVTANWFPAGGWQKFSDERLDRSWLPGWMQAGGYRTTLLGKFLNGFFLPLRPGQRCPSGWDVFEALSNGTYDYWNSSFSTGGGCGMPAWFPGQYQTDIIRDKALGHIDASVASGQPFFLYVTPAAPHTAAGPKAQSAPPPAARHANMFSNVKLPPNPTYNTLNPLIPDRLVDMSNPQTIAEMTQLYIARLRALRAVDEMLDAVVSRLQERGVLDNTYIIYTSDNGFHMGQHSLYRGKANNIEEDNRVPLFISGPGVPRGAVSSFQANFIDLAPTILALAGVSIPSGLDGLPLPLPGTPAALHTAALLGAVRQTAEAQGMDDLLPEPQQLPVPAVWWRETTLLESWEADGATKAFTGAVFKTLRVCSTFQPRFTDRQRKAAASNTRMPALQVPRLGGGSPPTYCLKYTVWCRGNTRELYDLSTDPYEQYNVADVAPQALINRLDAVMSVLVHCSGADCVHPHGVLHPKGNVLTFAQAMSPQYDALYAALPHFRFESCYPFYLPANEQAWTLGLPGFPEISNWADLGIVWPGDGAVGGDRDDR